MKIHNLFATVLFIFASLNLTVFGQTSDFTYQGKLTDTGTFSDSYDFRFSLFDVETAGTALGTLTRSAVPVTNGIFTVKLDFGANEFDGSERWLEIAVKRPEQVDFSTLSPRQPLTSAPYAIKSLKSLDSENLGGVTAANFLQTDGDGSNLGNVAKLDADNSFSGLGNSFPQITLSGDGEIIAPRLENAATDPVPASAANAGRVYFNTTDGAAKVSDGSAWVNLSMPSAPQPAQTFSGVSAQALINCSASPAAIRTAAFTKSSSSSRLRITFKDSALANSSAVFRLFVSARINGVLVSNPTALQMAFDAAGGAGIFGVRNSFVLFGYINGAAAGPNTLTFTYSFSAAAGSPGCFRDSEPFFIEIEEVP